MCAYIKLIVHIPMCRKETYAYHVRVEFRQHSKGSTLHDAFYFYSHHCCII